MHKHDTILLIGPHGAGKGASGEILSKSSRYVHVETGNIIRRLLQGEQIEPDLKKAMEIINAGKYLDDDLITTLLDHELKILTERRIYDPDYQFILLDGYPRTMPQVGLLEERARITQVIVFGEVSEDELVRRIVARGIETGRKGDTRENTLRRLKRYHEKTLPVVAHYEKNSGLVYHVDARKSLKAIASELETILASVFHSKDL